MNIIQIKCPTCGSVLSVRNIPELELKTLTCPVCKKLQPFSQFKRLFYSGTSKDITTSKNNEFQKSQDDIPTELPKFYPSIGKFYDIATGKIYYLKEGTNIIGRKASQSIADIEIDTDGKKSMSREHVVVNVKKIDGIGFKHSIRLFKEKVNPTYLDDEYINFGDTLILSDQQELRLPDIILKFEIHDEDITKI